MPNQPLVSMVVSRIRIPIPFARASVTNLLVALTATLGCVGNGFTPTPPPPPPPAPPPPPPGPPGVFPQLSPGFQARQMQVLGVTYKYQIFIPAGYTPSQTWPVVLYLHSSGGRGSDGVTQTSGVFGNWLRGAGSGLRAVVVFPQYPFWGEADQGFKQPWIDSIPKVALDSTLRQIRADTTRLYLTGWSLGGFIGWKIAYNWPNRFAAWIPLSGAVMGFWVFPDGGVSDSQARVAVAQRLRTLPIWAFVGTADEAGLLAAVRGTVQPFQAVGSPIQYTEFSGAPHNIEDLVYFNPAVWQWLFAQHR